jgi:hypothetical protein
MSTRYWLSLLLFASATGLLFVPFPSTVPRWKVKVIGADCKPAAGVRVAESWSFKHGALDIDQKVTSEDGTAVFDERSTRISVAHRLVAFSSHFGLPHGDLAPQLFTQAAVAAEFSTAEVSMYDAEKKDGELRSELAALQSCKQTR